MAYLDLDLHSQIPVGMGPKSPNTAALMHAHTYRA